MIVVIRPDNYDREPTIDFYEDSEVSLEPCEDFIIKKFNSIPELKFILTRCRASAVNIWRKVDKKTNLPTDVYYVNCLDGTYFIDDTSVAKTRLFKKWGLSVIIDTVNGKLVKCHFENRPYSYYNKKKSKGK